MTDASDQPSEPADGPPTDRPAADRGLGTPPEGEDAHPATEPIDLSSTGKQPAVPEAQRADSPPEGPRWSAPQARQDRPAPQPGRPAPDGPPPTGAAGPRAGAGTPMPATPGPTPPGGAAAGASRPGGKQRWLLVVAALVIGLIGGLIGGFGGARLADGDGQAGASATGGQNVGQVAATALPGVVTLKVRGGDRSGSGSGFVIREDGYILTNNHVASVAGDGGTLQAVFSDGTELPAKVVGQDASYDLAVVKVDKSGLKPLAFGKSGEVHVGDPVIAVGAPLGLESTVTTGIVSALDRPVVAGQSQDQASYINAIQTDAAINPGNSGGPLLDSSGRVIGINTAIARVPGSQPGGGSQGNIGLGFSIPADTAKRTSDQLIKNGKAEHPAIGARLDLSYTGQGAKVASSGDQPAVTPDGPADKAGIKDGDIVLEIDGRRVPNANMLIVTTRSKAVGETVRLLVRSGDSERTVSVKLAAADGDD